MKKIIIGLITAVPLLGFGLSAGATSTVFTIPAVGDLVGYAIDFGSPFLTALWPILGVMIGIAVVFFLISLLRNRF